MRLLRRPPTVRRHCTSTRTCILFCHLVNKRPAHLTHWQVLSTGLQAEAAGGDDNALLHNMTATLAAVSATLCVVSTFALVTRNTNLMAQLMVFQAFASPGLILCGFLLYASSAGLATGDLIVQQVDTYIQDID